MTRSRPRRGVQEVATPLNVRVDGDLVVLSNFGPLLNDPRHFDAGRHLQELLDQGRRRFVLELKGIREMGSTSMGLLVTLTRQVRQQGGELVLAGASRETLAFLDEMAMDDYWDVFESVDDAKAFFQRSST